MGGDTREPTGISSAARRHAIRKELMHVAPAPMLDETNSSCSYPRMGSNAVGEDARKFDQIRSARKDGATCRGPYVGPLTITLWNCRSLWAQGTTETIRFMMQLTRAHGITVLTETRESKERLLFLESMLPDWVQLYSSRINQQRGGVAIVVQSRFLQHFYGKPKWRVFITGRMARLEFSGSKGCLHVYAIYLSPEDPGERDKQLRRLADVIDPAVHNLITGDFNFVANDCDRINKSDGSCHNNAADKRNAATFKEVAATCSLKEFAQDEFTCENSYGWSRIDRLYTNLHDADLCSMRFACNLLEHPRHLSDHKPVSLSISAGGHNTSRSIPTWVTKHPEFKGELIEEFVARCEHFERCGRGLPSIFDKFKLLKESVHRAAAFIREESARGRSPRQRSTNLQCA